MNWIFRHTHAILLCMITAVIAGCGMVDDGHDDAAGDIVVTYRLGFPRPEGYELTIGYVETDGGGSTMEIAIWQDGKKTASSTFTVMNGGERGRYSVMWQEEYVVIILSGCQMDEDIFVTVSYDSPDKIVESQVAPAATPEAIDLGLSVLWASMNIGGEHEYKHGYHYRWPAGKDGAFMPDAGAAMSRRIEAEIGPGWRLPTAEEWQELMDNCKWEVLKSNDVDGFQLTGRKPGYYDKRLFLPFSGMQDGDEIVELRISGGYWSSTAVPEPGSDIQYPTYQFIKGHRDSSGIMRGGETSLEVMSRPSIGLSIRAVRNK